MEKYVCKYIPEENAIIIRKLMKECLKLGGKLVIYDTEARVYVGDDVNAAMKELDGGDEEVGINLYRPKGKDLWFGVLPYEEPEGVIYDCTDDTDAQAIVNHVTQDL